MGSERSTDMRKLFFLMILLTRPAAAFKLEYLDFLGPEVVGELKPRTYDLKLDDKFAGPTSVRPDTLIGGGFGLRLAACASPSRAAAPGAASISCLFPP
jgi:hypothetical protein